MPGRPPASARNATDRQQRPARAVNRRFEPARAAHYPAASVAHTAHPRPEQRRNDQRAREDVAEQPVGLEDAGIVRRWHQPTLDGRQVVARRPSEGLRRAQDGRWCCEPASIEAPLPNVIGNSSALPSALAFTSATQQPLAGSGAGPPQQPRQRLPPRSGRRRVASAGADAGFREDQLDLGSSLSDRPRFRQRSERTCSSSRSASGTSAVSAP